VPAATALACAVNLAVAIQERVLEQAEH